MPTDLSVGMENHALFLPAINETFARFPMQNSEHAVRSMPAGLTPGDLNYLDPESPLFHYHAGLHSAAFGVYEANETILSKRDRKRTIIVGDSGGFTEINNGLKEPLQTFRPKSLAWLEKICDVGIILDVPTRALDIKGGKYRTLTDCLDVTLDSIHYAIEKRSNSSMRLLSVMQGRDRKEARVWQEAVAPYQSNFEGIALAGAMKLDFALWAELLINMRDKKQLDSLRWIHVLGTAQPGVGVMLTGLQRTLRKHLHPDITISYDSSLAFRIVQVNKQITTGITYDRQNMRFLRYHFPDHWSALDRQARFPFSSPLGDRATVGDFNPANANSATGWDTLGIQMLSHHEVFKEVTALAEVNRLAEAETGTRGQIPWHIRQAWAGFEAIFSSQTPMTEIARHKHFLGRYSASGGLEDDDR
ncbi:hypothetical protein FS764_19330 [Agrobacterium vitis]|uniref:hypothetical protein n=1 Tax=Agrobacterium vitis TaxID=373 RepID=UPI001F1DE8D4|nr:hypothetical protein [Agrobacterium vitis]MCF1469058.1 hypothetical protein [Agrobacterium vitis]